MQFRYALGLVCALICAQITLAQDLPAPSNGITLRRQLQYPLINGASPSGASMSPDGKMIAFAWNKTGARMKDLWLMDYPQGASRQIIASNSLPRFPRQEDKRTDLQKQEEKEYDGGIGGVAWAPDSKEFMFQYRGKTWIYSLAKAAYQPLFDTAEEVSSPTYSDDGLWLIFERGGNVFRMSRATGAVKQLTFLAGGPIDVDSYEVSPDGQKVEVQWSDHSKEGHHIMMDYTKDRAEVVNIQRGWIGEMGQNIQIGFVPIDGGVIKFVPYIPHYTWVTTSAWSPDSRLYAFGHISEDFKTYTITTTEPVNMRTVTTYEEKAPKTYIPDFRTLDWTSDSKHILFTTDIFGDKFGYRSLMQIGPFDKTPTPVYKEDHDIAYFMRPKYSDRLIFVAHTRSPLNTEIVVQEPDGTRYKRTPLDQGCATVPDFDAAAPPLVSYDGQSIATIASEPRLNNELYSVWPDIRRLTESQLPEFKKIKLANATPVTFKAPDGATIYGTLLTPPDLDPNKKYPAIISNMYANSGRAQWVGLFDHYCVCELGMIVLKVNFRASYGQGGEFNTGYYKSMGIVDSDEAVAAKGYLTTLPYVRADRCGVWGWSYGGFLTLMIMTTKPDAFDTAVAVASVTDWKSYNEWYVRRRLGLPTEDAAAFKKSSPLTYTKGLKGNLLSVHGILDDNVLYQDDVQFREQLIRDGKFFDSQDYPRANHSIGRDEERPHVFETIARYLYNHLNRK